MRQLTGIEDDEALKNATGISELKSRVQLYLDEERTLLLQQRAAAMARDLLEPAAEMYCNVKRRHPEDAEQAILSQRKRRNILFQEWWGKHWSIIKSETKNRFDQRLNEFIAANQQPSNGMALHRRYCDLVKTTIAALPSRQSTEIEKIFDGIIPIFDPQKANIEWRERLYGETRDAVKTISQQLAIELQKETKELVADFQGQLWNSQQIESYLIDEHYLESLERSLTTLFLRFARPIAELLIRGPLGSVTREHIRHEIGPDVEIIDNYYQGDEPALKRVGRYANHGQALLINSELRKKILGDAAGVAKFILKKHPLTGVLLKVGETAVDAVIAATERVSSGAAIASKKRVVVDEVEADLQVLEHYLLNGVFEAAGLMQFARQELENLRDSFIDKKDT